MNYICIGKIVNTHALKGEVRIISNFEYKSRIFIKDFNLYIGNDNTKLIIESYRVHNNFDMVKFIGIDNINDVLKYKGSLVYINSDDLVLNNDELLEEELLNMNVYNNDKLIGNISEYRVDNGNKMIRVNNRLIPFNKDFIIKIDKDKHIIYMKNIEVFL